MNLKTLYSQPQAMSVLGFDYRMQIYRWRKREEPTVIRICKKPFYLRDEIDGYMEEQIRLHVNENLRPRFEEARLRAVRYDLDLHMWLPRCRIKGVWPYSFEMLYKVSTVRKALNMIRTKKAYGQHFFYLPDIREYVKLS